MRTLEFKEREGALNLIKVLSVRYVKLKSRSSLRDDRVEYAINCSMQLIWKVFTLFEFLRHLQ